MLVFLLNTNGKWEKCNYNERELSVVLQEVCYSGSNIFIYEYISINALYINISVSYATEGVKNMPQPLK